MFPINCGLPEGSSIHQLFTSPGPVILDVNIGKSIKISPRKKFFDGF